MTVANHPPPDGVAAELTARLRRRMVLLRWLLAAGIVVVLTGVALLVVLRHEDGKYGPISMGSSGGPTSQRRIVPYGDGQYRLATNGSETAYYYSSLANDGEHSVKIIRVEPDSITVAARWAPFPDGDDEVVFSPSTWRAFPAIVPAGSEIQVRYEIRRPAYCRDKPMPPGAGVFYGDDHVVRWESLLGEHTSQVYGDTDFFRIQLC